jgi:hypothetical protein
MQGVTQRVQHALVIEADADVPAVDPHRERTRPPEAVDDLPSGAGWVGRRLDLVPTLLARGCDEERP